MKAVLWLIFLIFFVELFGDLELGKMKVRHIGIFLRLRLTVEDSAIFMSISCILLKECCIDAASP